MKKIICIFFIAFCFHLSLKASAVPNIKNPASNKNVVFCLSTPRSGINLITGCLTAITRKPISWFHWGKSILNPNSLYRKHISYNRLGLELCSDLPLLYRSHFELDELIQVPSKKNKLIFVTRNPKELLYRKFFLQETSNSGDPDAQFIRDFLNRYLQSFEVFDAWYPDTKMILFYEDFIANQEEHLLRLLQFMDELPVFFEDFLEHKQEYLSRLLQSYSTQHTHNSGGASSKEGPQAIHYTKNASLATLQSIDAFLEQVAPGIWQNYLRRFETLAYP